MDGGWRSQPSRAIVIAWRPRSSSNTRGREIAPIGISALGPWSKAEVWVQTDAAMDPRARNSLVVFLAVTFALSAIFYAQSFSGVPLAQVAPRLMWVPGITAIVTQLAFHRTLAGLGWRLGPWRYLALAVLVPIAYCVVIYVPVWVAGLGRFDAAYFGKVLPFVPVALIQSLLTALGEEIGWRGFLAPTLYRAFGFAAAGL